MSQPPTPYDAAFSATTEPLKVSLVTTLAGEDAVNDRLKVMESYNYAVSISTGVVKASSGVLVGYWGGTAGTMAISDGTTYLGTVTVSANVMVAFPKPIAFASRLSISASAAVATIIYL